MKRVVSVLLCAVMLISISFMNANAALPPIAYGDANADGNENVFDVTFIQLCIASLEKMNKLQFEVSDVNDDGEINILDTTMIQSYIAGLVDSYPAGYTVTLDMRIDDFYCNYGDAVLTSNETATFYAEVSMSKARVVTYSFYVNDKLVKSSEDPYFKYCFEDAGEYDVTVVAESDLGVVKEEYLRVKSIGDATRTTPEIGVYYTNLIYNELCDMADDALMNVAVLGADEPFEYAFDLYDGDKLIASQMMSEDNTFALHPDELKVMHEYTMYVAVSTGDGNIYLRDVPVVVGYTKIG